MKETTKQFNDTNIAVVSIVVCQESCLFLQRNHAPKNWCPPCGRLKDNEDPLQGLKREVLEETGLEIIPLMCVDAWMGLHNGKNIFSVTYVCTAELLQVTLSSEHSAFLWIPIRDLLDRKIDTDFSIQKWPSLIKAALALTHENHLTTPHFVNRILDRAPEKKCIEIDGFKFQAHIEGQGPTALVIGSALYYPRSFSKELCSQFRMVFVDWRGFAKQETAKEQSVSFDTLLADIEKVRNALQIRSCILIGHSAHALLALEYAKKYPHAVSHLVMIGAAPNLSQTMHEAASRNWEESVWPERKEANAKRLQNLPDEELEKLPLPERFVAWYVRRDPQAWYDFNFNSSKLWEGIRPSMPLFDYLYGVALRDLDITKGLDSFKKPVFLALGRYDFIVAPPSSWDPFRAKFKDLTCRVFERSGHSPQYEEAHNFNKELITWFKKHQ